MWAMNKNMFIKLVSAGAVMLIAVILLLLNVTVLAPERHKGEKTVALVIEYSDQTYEYRDLKTNAETVLELLKEYDKALELQLRTKPSQYGDMLIGLKNAEQNEAAGAYYTFTVGGEYATNGISTQPIADGNEIKFSYGIATYDENWTQTSYTLAPSAGFVDSGVSGTYIAVWVCCGVGLAAGIGLLVYTLLDRKRKPKAQPKEEA